MAEHRQLLLERQMMMEYDNEERIEETGNDDNTAADIPSSEEE